MLSCSKMTPHAMVIIVSAFTVAARAQRYSLTQLLALAANSESC